MLMKISSFGEAAGSSLTGSVDFPHLKRGGQGVCLLIPPALNKSVHISPGDPRFRGNDRHIFTDLVLNEMKIHHKPYKCGTIGTKV